MRETCNDMTTVSCVLAVAGVVTLAAIVRLRPPVARNGISFSTVYAPVRDMTEACLTLKQPDDDSLVITVYLKGSRPVLPAEDTYNRVQAIELECVRRGPASAAPPDSVVVTIDGWPVTLDFSELATVSGDTRTWSTSIPTVIFSWLAVAPRVAISCAGWNSTVAPAHISAIKTFAKLFAFPLSRGVDAYVL